MSLMRLWFAHCRISGGNATTFVLQCQWTFNNLKYIAAKCPALQVLSVRVSGLQLNGDEYLAKVIGKFKNLKCLELQGGYEDYDIDGILGEISRQCRNFTTFSMRGIVRIESASAIVRFIPQIKHLNLSASVVRRDALIHILQGCRELEVLDISYCEGFEMDMEIVKMATYIKIFSFRHCRE